MIRKNVTLLSAAELGHYREKWLAIGLATGEGGHGQIEAAVTSTYLRAGLQAPTIIYLPSPLHGALGAFLLRNVSRVDQVWDQVEAQVRDQVWDQVGAQVRDQVGAQVRKEVWDQVGAPVRAQVREEVGEHVWERMVPQVRDQMREEVGEQVRDQVEAEVRDQVWDRVGAQVREEVWDQVGAQVRDLVWDQVWHHLRDHLREEVRAQVREEAWDQVWALVCGRGVVYGQHDAAWLGYYDALCKIHQPCRLDCLERLRPFMDLAEQCGWWWALATYAIVTPRPSLLRRDSQHRLHSSSGPALDYDGAWSIWAWHGVRVSQAIIEGHYSASDALAEPNLESRRVMMEIMGPERFFCELNPNVIHADRDGAGNPRRLLRVKVHGFTHEYVQAVQVQCPSTGRQFILGVPSTVSTCHEAVAATFGMRPEQYAPEVET